MKLESLENLYFVLAFVVPGFVYWNVLRQFVPLRPQSKDDNVLLTYAATTILMYSVWSPLILWIMATNTASSLIAAPAKSVIIFVSLVFVGPMVLAVIRAYMIQYDGDDWLCRKLRLRPVHPIPTGWDWKFSRTAPSYVIVTMQDGKAIAGWFGTKSMASSDPERRDLFLEQVFTIPADGSPWIATPGSDGVYIDGKQIANIEFRS